MKHCGLCKMLFIVGCVWVLLGGYTIFGGGVLPVALGYLDIMGGAFILGMVIHAKEEG
jgi:hypothetical protein